MFRNLSLGALGIRADLPTAIELAGRAGWQGLELPLAEATALGASAVAEQLAAAGLRAGGAGLALNWRRPYPQAALAELAAQAAVARQLGCTRMHTWVLPASDDLPFRENFEWHVAQLQPIASALAGAGCRLGLEFVGPRHMRAERRYGFVYTIDAMLSLAAAVGPNVGLLVDCFHWYAGLGTLADLRALRADDVVYVHVNDAPAGVALEAQHDRVRRLPGATGVIDLAGFLGALGAIGYDGPVTPEPFDPALAQLSPEQASATAHAHMLAVWKQAGLE